MSTIIWQVFWVLAIFLCLGEGARRERNHWRALRKEFAERFPDKCYVCSKGRALHYLPTPHDCKES